MKTTARRWLSVLTAFPLLGGMLGGFPACAAPGPIPVVLDTDIGGDIDDTWALGFLLRCPELDLKLALGEFGQGEYRAALIAKLLTTAGRTDVPVGVGIEVPGAPTKAQPGLQELLVGNFALGSYAGPVRRDGVQALIDTIMASPVPVTVICVGAPVNIAEALRRQPAIASRARFVGMFGSVRRGYAGNPTPCIEANVVGAIAATRTVFAAPWKSIVVTPLDTCGLVRLGGAAYQEILASPDPVAKSIVDDYRIFTAHPPAWAKNVDPKQAETRSTVLFDTVAVYLAFSRAGLKVERLPLAVTDQGMTIINSKGPLLDVATEWTDLESFNRLLVHRLTHPTAK